jgi:hypothetical protein
MPLVPAKAGTQQICRTAGAPHWIPAWRGNERNNGTALVRLQTRLPAERERRYASAHGSSGFLTYCCRR